MTTAAVLAEALFHLVGDYERMAAVERELIAAGYLDDINSLTQVRSAYLPAIREVAKRIQVHFAERDR